MGLTPSVERTEQWFSWGVNPDTRKGNVGQSRERPQVRTGFRWVGSKRLNIEVNSVGRGYSGRGKS